MKRKITKGVSKQAKRPVGHPSCYKDDYARQARILAERGCSNGQIAKALKVAVSTVYAWLEEYPEFGESVQAGRSVWENEAQQIGKMGLVINAQQTVQIKTIKELRTVGPKCPPKDTPKGELLDFAGRQLKMAIDPQLSKAAIYRLVRSECGGRQKEKLVVVRKEETPILPNVGASGKLAAGIGDKKTRMTDSTKVDLGDDTVKSLVDIAAIMVRNR